METKARIVEATADLFQQYGYSGTGLKQISARAAAPFGSIYHFFPGGKEQLGDEVIRQAGLAYQELVLGVLRSAADPVAGVRAAFSGAAELLVATDYQDACPIATVALEVASSNEVLRVATAEVFEGWTVAFADFLVDHGVPLTQSRRLAVVTIELLEGAFLLCRAAKRTEAMDHAGETAALLVGAAVSVDEPRPAGGTPCR